MPQEILINAGAVETRIAVVEEGRLQALAAELTLGAAREGGRSRIGDILVGRVQRVVPAVQAAFVEIGMERAGFLGLREAEALNPQIGEGAIGDYVREGDAVLVQIVKDPIGDKGARLSASISIAGRLAVLTPLQNGIALSRRILDEMERTRLDALGGTVLAEGVLPQGAGLILRTCAYGVSLEALREEAAALGETWGAIAAARARGVPPALLFRDLGPIERALRDLARGDTDRILIDEAFALEAARAYCRHAMPEMEPRLRLFEGPGALFDLYGIEEDIAGLSQTRVTLPSGGWITVEATEALTAVDVNSGSFTAASGLADMGLTVNLEAAHELGRQLRLRGIGGVIVADFIHMDDEGHIARVLHALEDSMARDGTPTAVAPISPFGLVEITRKRVREPRHMLYSESCPCCGGAGRLRRAGAVALDVVRAVEAAARATPGAAIRVEAAADVVRWLEAQGEDLLAALARKGAGRVRLDRSETLPTERYDVGTES
jgi:ribonuclease G